MPALIQACWSRLQQASSIAFIALKNLDSYFHGKDGKDVENSFSVADCQLPFMVTLSEFRIFPTSLRWRDYFGVQIYGFHPIIQREKRFGYGHL
jgi:hypothetical protein